MTEGVNPAEILKQCVEIISKVDVPDERKTKLAALAMVASNKLASSCILLDSATTRRMMGEGDSQ